MVFLLATILKCRSAECTTDVLDYIVTPFPPPASAPPALQFDLVYSYTFPLLYIASAVVYRAQTYMVGVQYGVLKCNVDFGLLYCVS